jgi:hypothetical protein
MMGGSRCAAGELKSSEAAVPLPVITADMASQLPMFAGAVKCQVTEAGCRQQQRRSE